MAGPIKMAKTLNLKPWMKHMEGVAQAFYRRRRREWRADCPGTGIQ